MVFRVFGKVDFKGRSDALRAVKAYSSAQIRNRVLDYRKPQPRAACLFRAALVGAVEPLEHPVKVFGRDSDACIGNRDDRLVFFFADGHTDFAARFGVTERIVAKIVNYLVQKSANARHGNFFAADGNFDVFILCGRRKRTDFLFRKREGLRPHDAVPAIRTDLRALDPKSNLLVWFGHSS